MTKTVNKRYAAQATFPALDRSRKGPGRSEIPDAEPVSGTPPDTVAPATTERKKAAQAQTSMSGATQPVRSGRLAAVAAAPAARRSAGAAASAMFDGDPLTVPNWAAVVSAVMAGIGLIFAKDAGKANA